MLGGVTTYVTIELMHGVSPFAREARAFELSVLPVLALLLLRRRHRDRDRLPEADHQVLSLRRVRPGLRAGAAPGDQRARRARLRRLRHVGDEHRHVPGAHGLALRPLEPGPHVAAGAGTAGERLPRDDRLLSAGRLALPCDGDADGVPARPRRGGLGVAGARRPRPPPAVPDRGRVHSLVHAARARARRRRAPRGRDAGGRRRRLARAPPARSPSGSSSCSASCSRWWWRAR